MSITMFGIPNCNSIKKAKDWLTAHNIAFDFHNFKKDGITVEQLHHWCELTSWETLLNKRGTTWRKLDESQKENLDQNKAISLMLEYPSMIKRPVLTTSSPNRIVVGFDDAMYAEAFTTND